jgi:voltage-gated potassium channel
MFMLDVLRKWPQVIGHWLSHNRFAKASLVLAGVVVIGTFGLSYFESISPVNALWWTVVTVSTVGYGDITPQTLGGRMVGVVAMFSGIGLLGTISAMLASTMVSANWRKTRGMETLNYRHHFIICGWNHKAREMISELRADQGAQDTPVVLIANLPELPLEAADVAFVRGEVTPETMQQANMREARAVMILSDEQIDVFSRDARSILTTLTIKKAYPYLYICVELADSNNRTHCQLAGADEMVVSGALTSHLLVLAALDPGVTNVVSELLSRHVGIQELYLTPIKAACVGRTFLDILSRLKETDDVLTLGVQHADGSNCLNPPPDYEMQAGDQLFVVASQRPDLTSREAAASEP